MTCEEFEELSGAYVLDAITPAERQAAEAHLATCVKCTRLLQELRGVVTLLPLSVPQVHPSPELKERILAAIRQEDSRTNGRQPVGRRRRQSWLPRILVAAALLLFCFSGVMVTLNISLNHQVTSLQQQLTKGSGHPVTAVATYTVKGTSGDEGATGRLLYLTQQNITVLIIYGLPELQGVHVYQGWLVHLNRGKIIGFTSIGLLNVENGSASLSFSGNVTGYDETAISVEPGPSATPKAPKGTVVASGLLKVPV